MINAHRTGAYISSLRKSKDWTQADLAQRLQVTHQAVSQWEKGATLPDITLLPSLARLFGVTVDDLLNGGPAARTSGVTRGAIVEELAHGTPSDVARLVRSDPEGVDKMLEAAPMTPPSQMEAVVANMAGFEFTLNQIVELAPFVSRDLLDTLLAKAKVERVESELLMELAPYVSRETLDRWVAEMHPGSLDLATVIELAPYVGRETLARLVDERLDGDQPVSWEQVEELAPYLAREGLESLVGRLPMGMLTLERVVELAPFVGTATLDTLIAQADDPQGVAEHLDNLAPHLSQASLVALVAKGKVRLSTQALLDLAPYLGKEMLDSLLRPKA